MDMGRAAAIGDLFGHVPQAGELPINTHDPVPEPRNAVVNGLLPVPPGGHTPDTVRVQAAMIMDDARGMQTLQWSPREVRSFTGLFPYLCEWLKGGEGDRLLAEFKAEMDRLEAPVDQVAPNWRAIWGLDGDAGG